jgi:glycosyltransferase involved in cell wall biosynthesis
MAGRMNPRVAIACSGLGHVRRGNETWANSVAQALHETGANVTLFGGGPTVEGDCPYVRLANLRRDGPLTRAWLSWHYRYLIEQYTFCVALIRHLRRERFDIVHMADPALALRLQRSAPELAVRVVYKDGLLLGPAWCRKFDFVQVLAPFYREQAETEGAEAKNWFVIPHLVDTRRFKPPEDRTQLRKTMQGGRLAHNVGPGSFVALAVGDFSPGSNKRLDWIVGEFARLPELKSAHLLIAGSSSSDAEFKAFCHEANQRLFTRVHLFANLSRSEMVEMYQAADAFAHAALREPFGIVFLEAMACGLPIAGHDYAVTRWIIGDAGQSMDMTTEGKLAAVLGAWQSDPVARMELSQRARARAEGTFAPDKIVPLYQELYRRVAGVK